MIAGKRQRGEVGLVPALGLAALGLVSGCYLVAGEQPTADDSPSLEDPLSCIETVLQARYLPNPDAAKYKRANARMAYLEEVLKIEAGKRGEERLARIFGAARNEGYDVDRCTAPTNKKPSPSFLHLLQ